MMTRELARRRPFEYGDRIIEFKNVPVVFLQIPDPNAEVDEYWLKIGKCWLFMGLVADSHRPEDWDHPNVHFVFAETEAEVGEHLLRLYPQYGADPKIEVRKAKVHRFDLPKETKMRWK